ncbi:MAG: ACP S-malonyltransferase [Desulfobacteraceae bacterium]|nr:ACP S-malonyltransferase [Desulfobacteraceae bacterium]MBC2718613.1 ACP S-malonyltransferase [Desulfobacteraceae bacterium]
MKKEIAAFIFPAFGKPYTGFKNKGLDEYQERLRDYLSTASQLVSINNIKFERACNGIIEDDLHAHYSCYINSCIISDILKDRNIHPQYAVPFSMGLYAALYYTSSVSFENLLLFMHNQLASALNTLNDVQYGMVSIVGLPFHEVEELIRNKEMEVEVVDAVNELVQVVAGKRVELEKLMLIAKENGSSHARMLPVSLPYHSSYMKKIKTIVEDLLLQIEILTPEYPIISNSNQKVLTTKQEIRNELANNISGTVHWLNTMNKMHELGINVLIECGLSNALCKLVKLFNSDFQVYHPRKFSKLFRSIA